MSLWTEEDETKSSKKSWLILLATAFGFLLWGSILFFGIGDKGPPDWDYSVVPDVPGLSPYSTRSEKGTISAGARSREGAASVEGIISEQHVAGPSKPLPPAPSQGAKP